MRARSSAEPPNSMSTHGLVDHLARAEADDMDAEDAVGAASARIFTKPSVWRMARARPLAVKGNLPTL